MKVGDLIKLHQGAVAAQGLSTNVALLVEKLPRPDHWEYDWSALVGGRLVKFGRQLEDSNPEVLSASR